MLNMMGHKVNHKKVYRIWREAGLKVPQKQKKHRRLWLNDGSCIRLRPEHQNHVWSYDIVTDKLSNKKHYRILNVIDEYTRECLACYVAKNITAMDCIEILTKLFIKYGLPKYLRSDNGSEFTANTLKKWLSDLNVTTAYIEPGSPWENGYVESFNGRMRDELLDGEIFDTITEARVIIEQYRIEYNTDRPHSGLGGKPPAPLAKYFPARLKNTIQASLNSKMKSYEYMQLSN